VSQVEFDSDTIEKELCLIADIEAARIVFNGSNTVEELHILALPNKGPKQILRDVESALMARFGLDVDHRKISVAQLGSNGNGAKAAFHRPKVISINTEITDLSVGIKVELRIGNRDILGKAEGIASQTGRLRLAAEATLEAVENCKINDSRFILEDAVIVQLGNEVVAVSCVTMVSSGEERRYCGSVIVKNSEMDSIVRATLAAINRRFGI